MSAMPVTEPVVTLAVATDAHEGPVVVPDEGTLYFTSTPRAGLAAGIRRLSLRDGRVTRVPSDAVNPNGMALAPDGRLLVCEQGSFDVPARLTLVDRRTGAAEVVVDTVDGLPLNSPNDVVVGPDGALWLTDPSYGFLQGFRPRPRRGAEVLRHDPRSGRTEAVVDGGGQPNGLAFSPGGRTLYVGDSERHRVDVFAVAPERRPERLASFPIADDVGPDGLEVDAVGHVYACGARGVHVHGPAGEPLDLLPVPGAVHLAWVPPARELLLVTADTAIWSVPTRHLQEA